MSRFLKLALVSACVAALGTALGCAQEEPRPGEILLAYSGDCQAYLEPCG